MSCICSTKILSFVSGIDKSIQSLIRDEVIAYEGKAVKVIVPKHPLAAGSLKIIPNSDTENFSHWNDLEKQEAYALIQNIVQIWKEKGITDYVIYGKESNNANSPFGWEVIPYPKEGWFLWTQFKVLWNITFGGSSLSKIERNRIARDFQTDRDSFLESHVEQIESIKQIENDVFCNQKVIDRQLVFEGKENLVLYDYAPLTFGKERLHFLIIPKKHRSKFSDLTESEYLEAMQLSQKLVSFYKNKGHDTAYIFDKSGKRAGQEVPHWHEHVVLTASKTQEFFGKLNILKNMLIGSSPLPPKELQTRVESLKKELSQALK